MLSYACSRALCTHVAVVSAQDRSVGACARRAPCLGKMCGSRNRKVPHAACQQVNNNKTHHSTLQALLPHVSERIDGMASSAVLTLLAVASLLCVAFVIAFREGAALLCRNDLLGLFEEPFCVGKSSPL